jgi:hypothetical protein
MKSENTCLPLRGHLEMGGGADNTQTFTAGDENDKKIHRTHHQHQRPFAPLLVHRSPTRALQASLSLASRTNRPLDRLIYLISDSTLRCYVIFGIPLVFFPCGFYIIACLVTLAVFLFSFFVFFFFFFPEGM